MKIKTSELKDSALDYATAIAEAMIIAKLLGRGTVRFERGLWTPPLPTGGTQGYVLRADLAAWQRRCDGYPLLRSTYIWSPSTDGSQAIPIMEREDINTNREGEWKATIIRSGHSYRQFGPTLLVAAMRCYVASKLGDEVEIPQELL